MLTRELKLDTEVTKMVEMFNRKDKKPRKVLETFYQIWETGKNNRGFVSTDSLLMDNLKLKETIKGVPVEDIGVNYDRYADSYYHPFDEHIPRDTNRTRRLNGVLGYLIFTKLGFKYEQVTSREVKDVIHHTFIINPRNKKDINQIKDIKLPKLINNDEVKETIDSIKFDILVDPVKGVTSMVAQININSYTDNTNLEYYEYHIKKYDIKNTERLLSNILMYQMGNTIPNSQVASKLKRLWLYQIQQNFDENDIIDHNIPEISTDLLNIFENIKDDLVNTGASGKDDVILTYNELFELFKEIETGELTNKTATAQKWLSFSSVPKALEMFSNHEHFNRIQSIHLAPEKQYKDVKKELLRDGTLKRRYNIKNIYSLNEERKPRKGNKIINGVHGTINNGLISVLLNGLKTPRELHDSKTKFRNTAQGLGQGVYFARPYQTSKSANYTGRSLSKVRYLLWADIEYDPETVITTKSYNSALDTSKCSLVFGDRVGGAGLDELVAPQSNQINIRYIIEIEEK